jgi:hypothetical protein
MELTQRKLEILRRVVEEYFATGQPVGSRSLVERPGGLEVSSSTQRAVRARGGRPLTYPLPPVGPHAERVPRYTECLVGAIDGGRRRSRSTHAMRNEVESAGTTEALSETTHLLALVTARARGGGRVRSASFGSSHTSSSSSSSPRPRRLEAGLGAGGRRGRRLVDWARAYLAETIVGKRASASASVARSRSRSSPAPSEPRRCDRVSPTWSRARPTSASAAPPGCSGRSGAARGASGCSRRSSGGGRPGLHDALTRSDLSCASGPSSRARVRFSVAVGAYHGPESPLVRSDCSARYDGLRRRSARSGGCVPRAPPRRRRVWAP